MRKFILNFFVLALFCFSIPLQKAKADANRTLGIIGTALGGTALGLSGLNTLALARRGAFSGGNRFNGGYGYNSAAYGYGGGAYPAYGGGYASGGCGCANYAPPSCCSAPVVNSCCAAPIMPSSCCSPPIQYSYSYMPVTTYVPVMQAIPPSCCGSSPVGCSSSLYGGFYR